MTIRITITMPPIELPPASGIDGSRCNSPSAAIYPPSLKEIEQHG